ncbi:uncharacterized protein LOC109794449 [Cajanus cajan]|uniref:uncharacterized protein LOC109794449 n=1 Tax=Cajanus cajan TaxID=3821 RepID=UPI00098D93E9|nr:uncharacterized protein LOC109794449 [Cajanus cajan]
MERSMIDAASGGALGDMTPAEARHLIEKMASNSQQFSWRNHPNLRWSNQQQQQQPSPAFQNIAGPSRYVPPPIQQQQRQHEAPTPPAPQPSTCEPSLEELVRQITAQSQNSDRLPSQIVQNPKNVSVITLRSWKQIDIPITVPPPPSAPVPVQIPAFAPERNDEPVGARNFHAGGPSSSTNFDLQQPPIALPFPPKLIPCKKMEEVDKEILETFRKVEVNIPLLDAIKQIPRYTKFLKELCTHKRKMKGNERINMGRNVYALIGKSVPHIHEKCKDPGTFCIPCIIRNSKFENAMLDLGASINVMPLSIFKSLSLGPMQPTGVVIQLANRSVTHPTGFIEDVLVRVEVHALEPLVPSTVQPTPIPELKPLLENLKYAYLEDDEKLPVIISTSLDAV